MRVKKIKESMRSRLLSCGLCLLLGTSALTGQTQPAVRNAARSRRPSSLSPHSSDSAQLVTADDGLTILGAALEHRYKTEKRSDCSHLVHAIYDKAGFPYKYQSSSDLYAGVEEFRRVTKPQPGDLIVWVGHAGIVVSPAQHTFYSALRSGFGMQPYDSAYWKGRGRPHFFRYVKAISKTVLAAKRTPALKATGLGSDSHSDIARPESAKEVVGRMGPEEDVTKNDADAAPELPRKITIYASRIKSDQIGNALREQFQAFADTLETRDLLALEPSVVSFDRFEVEKLQLKGNEAHAQLHIHGAVELAGSRAGEREEVQKLDLHRANGGWEVLLPSNAIYVPRETVVRILAHQLAALTDDANPPETKDGQKVQLARWLNVLLAESSPH